LFTTNNFVASLTFHGGDNVIGYPWGAFSRSYIEGYNINKKWYGYQTPDYNSFDSIGNVLSKKAG